MSSDKSIQQLTEQVNQMCFQVGQLSIQNKINEARIADITSRATSLAKKIESIKSNLPKGDTNEPQENAEPSGSSEQPGEVGTAEV